jgi:hypothetical protein
VKCSDERDRKLVKGFYSSKFCIEFVNLAANVARGGKTESTVQTARIG